MSERSVERWRRAWREGGRRPCVPLGRRGCQGSRMPNLRCWRRNWARARPPMASKISGGPGPGSGCNRPPFPGECVGGDLWRPLKKYGWSRQAPARRAMEQDEHAMELWPRVKAPRRRPTPGSSSRTRPGLR
ncbi:transposase [Streptomyces sp. NPDC087532]|uniref:transposase n=1 Tax=unclassified Streptomyces TaxID=2593676 RepID=UPI00332C9E7B